jgi:hypothetical protein
MSIKEKAAGHVGAGKLAYWTKQISEWGQSGQSQRAFCAQRGLVFSTFRWWRRQVTRRDAVKPVTPFLPIAMGSMGQTSVVEVQLRSRTRLRFEGEAALRAVAQLVALVK